MATQHESVLKSEVMQWLDPQPGQILVDGTVGGGGHTRLLAERVGAGGLIVGLDRDPAALDHAQSLLSSMPVRLVHGSFAELPEILHGMGIASVDGVLLDLGMSSDQLADESRGFSYEADGPLDLRFDTSQGEPAWRLLERLSEKRLADLIFEFGEERFSRRIAKAVVAVRRRAPIRTSRELADLVLRSLPRQPPRRRRIHPATRTFQALRIAVNNELAALDRALDGSPRIMRSGARIAVISFHSLEDRRVKHAFRNDPRYAILTKKPIRPIEEEVLRNPRARSARMRVGERQEE
jgi:16S rRNA (cytosine1402-N4)-methyltransferase